jgi:hypothetical protein
MHYLPSVKQKMILMMKLKQTCSRRLSWRQTTAELTKQINDFSFPRSFLHTYCLLGVDVSIVSMTLNLQLPYLLHIATPYVKIYQTQHHSVSEFTKRYGGVSIFKTYHSVRWRCTHRFHLSNLMVQ